jgi:hypothetical protein
MGVVLGKLHPKPPRLNANGGVALRIESRRPPQNLGGDLIFLQGNPRVIQRMPGKIAEQFAEGLRAMKDMTFSKSLYLLEALLSTDRK